MTKIEEITTCIHHDLEKFETMFSQTLSTEKSELDVLLKYLLSMKGKRIRPIITLLIAACFNKITEQTLRSAVIIELLHTASLLHDDVIDESSYRRNEKTLNALWNNKVAILTGDYLYGKALSLIKTQEDFNLMPIYAKIAMDLPKGEIEEIKYSNIKNISIDFYLKIIYEKTASLIEAAMVCGVLSCGDNNVTDNEKIRQMGYSIGMAFQIKDDLLDYSDQTGKEKGIDIREKKITLPFLYYMETLSEQEKENTLTFLYSNKTRKEIESLISKIVLSGAVSRAEREIRRYSSEAKNMALTLPKNIYSKSLINLIDYLTKRNT